MKSTKILLALLLLISLDGMSQEKEFYNRLASLNYSDQLPEEILSSKTVVFVKAPLKSQSPEIRANWSEIAEVAQPGFKKAGIDAVTYYYMDDFFSGYESYDAFLDALDARDLSHAAFLFYDGKSYQLILLKLKDRSFLIANNQEAWKMEGVDLKKILEDLYRVAANSNLKKTNLLIIGNPQYGDMVSIIKGRRSEFYDLNFSSEKLAVPQFADTAAIAEVMKNYPYKWGFVEPGFDEKELRSMGYQYILYYTHSSGKAVKQILEYEISDNESAYVSEVVNDGASEISSYNINTQVYKFYVKHIYSENNFVGKRWDAAPSWQKALANYITNLRNELVRK